MINKLKNDILDLIFPPHCLACGRLGKFICRDCDKKIIIKKNINCPFCHRKSLDSVLCKTCRSKYRLRGLVSAGYFHDPVLKEVIHKFKYEGISAAGGELAQKIKLTIDTSAIDFDVIAYVPVSRKRLNERGYNQAEVLAKELGLITGRPVYKGLVKQKHTATQVGLRRKDRLLNLHGAFIATKTDAIEKKRVLLVDDVITTGATLGECARTLKLAGAKQVWGAVLAKE